MPDQHGGVRQGVGLEGSTMPQPMQALMPLRSQGDLFGAEVRHWRLWRGLSVRELGELTHDSGSMLSKVERAERRPTLDLARRLDRALDTDGALEHVLRRSVMPASTAATASPSGLLAAVPRRVSEVDVDLLGAMASAFADADHRSGGGHVRSSVEQYVDGTARPLLAAGSQPRLRPALLTAVARLINVAGFAAFDCGDHDRGRTLHAEAHQVAVEAGNAALAAYILADAAMLNVYGGRPAEAIEQADLGARTADQVMSPATVARCQAMKARAHARAGDHRACREALLAARTLARAASDGEPSWVSFFNAEQLAAEAIYALHDCNESAEVIALSNTVLSGSPAMARRRVLITATVASAHLNSHRRTPTTDAAYALLMGLHPQLGAVTSARAYDAISHVRRGLAEAVTREQGKAMELAFAEALGA